MPINVSNAICSLTGEIVNVERRSGRYTDGIYSSDPVQIFSARASVQQPSAQDLKALPEGERNADLLMFYSLKELRVIDDRRGTLADIVMYQGERYKIVAQKNWQAYGYTSAIGARIQPTSDDI